MTSRAYHAPSGDPCILCGLRADRHWYRSGQAPYQRESRLSLVAPKRTRVSRRFWVGLDGEGLGRFPHRYVYLAYSDASKRHTDSIKDYNGLKTIDCLDFLLSIPSEARVAGYFLGYDWTKIFKDLPKKAIYDLLRPETRYLGVDGGGNCRPIRWRGYKIQYIARTVRVSRHERTTTIWDVGPFFQCAFVKAVEAWNVGTKETLKHVELMKAKRSQFNELDDIESYCLQECELLAELATNLEAAHRAADLPLRSYHGPGATANVALKRMGIREKRGSKRIPKQVSTLALKAFFGGRFEHSTIGEVGTCYGEDIVSAYPFEAYNLPCLEHSTWEETTNENDLHEHPHALVSYAISDCGDEPWGPLPCRTPDGSIVFARGGFSGCAWSKEYRVAAQHWPGIHFKSAWLLKSDCACRPFAEILEWFKERERLGKDGKGRILKLALNSIYGKLAQSVGKPQYRSIVWAGMITSGTRSRLLETIGPNKHDILACATDGIFCKRKLNMSVAPLSDCRLGSWEGKTHHNTVLVRPGIYWSDDQLKARGLGAKQLKSYRSRVLYAIRKGLPEAKPGKAPVFLAARQSVYKRPDGTLKKHRLYGEWIQRPVRIRLTPLPKRNPDWSLRMLDNIESQPYGIKSKEHEIMKKIEELLWGQPQ